MELERWSEPPPTQIVERKIEIPSSSSTSETPLLFNSRDQPLRDCTLRRGTENILSIPGDSNLIFCSSGNNSGSAVHSSNVMSKSQSTQKGLKIHSRRPCSSIIGEYVMITGIGCRTSSSSSHLAPRTSSRSSARQASNKSLWIEGREGQYGIDKFVRFEPCRCMNGPKASGKECVVEMARVCSEGKLQSRRARYSFCLGFRKCRV